MNYHFMTNQSITFAESKRLKLSIPVGWSKLIDKQKYESCTHKDAMTQINPKLRPVEFIEDNTKSALFNFTMNKHLTVRVGRIGWGSMPYGRSNLRNIKI